ncbi:MULTISPECIES: dTDP-glucose 4,6-dehydratase [unclassified Streptomyces]|uniref:dTDP-glucose 4,6-dehydratase n=1 Tax=unclassified Streptomyces TaxID=2593676 RepID=UPI0024A95502|nr:MULTISPECIES: dTDP-glucose 4,6-dehydratase [unclassified Streptomyces]
MSSRILVTGGAGFIGSHYVRTLLGSEGPGDVSLTVLDKLTYAGNLANLEEVADHPDFAFVQGDICDAELVAKLMAEHDEVVHFAAESHVDRSIGGGAEFVRTNVVGTHTLIEAAHQAGGRIFVHVSTDEVYGSIDHGSWPEIQPLAPNSPYSAAKASSDLLSLSYHRTHGLDVRVTRCSNNYGHHHYPEKLIPLFVTNLLDGKKVPLYGDGGNVRDWLHIDDHVQGIDLVRTKGRAGEIYNIGGGTELTNKELTGLLLDACGADWDSSVEYVADRLGHDRRYSVDCGKIRRELGYAPRKDFREGLAETVRWYRDNRAWWEPLVK